jgi:hypothetical protein
MVVDNHLSSNELMAASHDAASRAAIEPHLDQCIPCRVRLARMELVDSSNLHSPSSNSVARILAASMPLPELLVAAMNSAGSLDPRPNELWRVGRDEALMVWVRKVFDDGVADVIPVVLDTDLADEETVLITADSSPLETAMAAMVALRTHIASATFIGFVCELDIAEEVEEVIAATRQGREVQEVAVGLPIAESSDQRLEYRQVLRDLLGDLSPSVIASEDEVFQDNATAPVALFGDAADVAEAICARLEGVKCVPPQPLSVRIHADIEAKALLKVIYLDTAVLAVVLDDEQHDSFDDLASIASACQHLCHNESDADAVAVTLPYRGWSTVLFRTADMRSAYQVPSGATTGPKVTLQGHDLVETLFKYLDAFAMTSWNFVDTEPVAESRVNLGDLATRHVRVSMSEVKAAGSRAQQPAKRTAWTAVPPEVEESVIRFIVSVAGAEPLAAALADLTADVDND